MIEGPIDAGCNLLRGVGDGETVDDIMNRGWYQKRSVRNELLAILQKSVVTESPELIPECERQTPMAPIASPLRAYWASPGHFTIFAMCLTDRLINVFNVGK